MDCTVVVTDDRVPVNEKQNVSVILVPESVILALSGTANQTEENTNPQKADHTSKRQDPESETFSDNGAHEQPVDEDLNACLLAQQQSQLIVLESGDWFVDADLTNGPNNELNSAPKQNSVSLNQSPNHMLRLVSSRTEENTKQPLTSVLDNQESESVVMCKYGDCRKTFATEKDASIHLKSHKKSNTYHCEHPRCPWSFATPYKLRRHSASHRQAKSFKCNYPGCEISCSTSYNLKVHEKFHTQSGYSHCPRCNKIFNSKLAFQKHQRAVHKIEPRFQCTVPECGKKFHTEGARKVHLRTHAKLDFVCGFEGCGKRFKQPAVFREHYMSRHTALRPFKCRHSSCKWEFTTKAKLKRHELTHTDEKRHCCPVEGCNARFFRQEHVRSHLKVHNVETEKKKDGSDLEAPIEFNLDDYIYYFCPYEDCGSLFTSFAGAKQHIQKLHAVTPIQSATVASSNEILETTVYTEDGKSMDIAQENKAREAEKEARSQSSTAVSDTQSILKTLMQVDSTGVHSSETSTIESLSAPQVQLSFVATSSNAISISIPPIMTSQIASASTNIDPSQFLLEPATDFVATTPSKAVMGESEPMGFINLHQSIYSAQTHTSADRFLSFNGCVQTVDPNVVMSMPSSVPVFKPRPAALRNKTSDDDEELVSEASTANSTSGSARTDCDAYRRMKIVKKWSPGRSAGSDLEKTVAVDLGGAADSFDFSEGESSPEKQMHAKVTNAGHFKNVLPDKHFTGSTINLSDLV